MKATELQELSEAELETKLGELTEERFRLRFRSATEAIEDTSAFRSLRRDVARIKTILRQREQAGQA
ncbi:MAG: 50S ribosomal protein L29 [Gemmatimonadetes bacterium]|jgi:large subunit ribosomal protein L29|nr:MAG: 50S ribosomal protein L29 [Gemmatimonadota bacterium]